VITLDGVSVSFGEVEALRDATLTCQAGKTTALIGPSGCGKSTVLRLIVGLVNPDSGRIEFAGQQVDRHMVSALRRRMGYVIQDGGLFPHLTARRNATLMARHIGQPPQVISERVRALCDLTHFPEDALERYPAELSGGQRQRVALMRGLMLDPEVLLLDEPLGALDPMVRSSLQTELKEIFGKLGKTVVLVTHDMAEAAFLADEIAILREGRIVQKGSLADLRERPADPFVTHFLHSQRSLVTI
jgi:osmoprotectant transport system ATP-binding protein